MTIYRVELSRQDLAEFLDDSDVLMERYAQELGGRLATGGDSSSVEITDTLADKFSSDDLDDSEVAETVLAIMAEMANDFSWAEPWDFEEDSA